MATPIRSDNRNNEQLRPWTITTGVLDFAEGSALIEAGRTRVLVAASVEDRVPAFLKGQGTGWVTAEYSMLPRASLTRSQRDRSGKVGGRTMEIQRLVGRSLRAVTHLPALGERTITLDCDVIQADGGTRVAAVTGAWVALKQATASLVELGVIGLDPVTDTVSAVSVGIVDGRDMLDLDYEEDSSAEVDMNVVMTGRDKLVEVQATAEGYPFSVIRMNALIRLASKGIKHIRRLQQACL